MNVTGSVATTADLPDDAQVGDAYIAADTRDLWIRDGSDWVDTGPVQGPKGDKGDKGDTGPQGEKGDKGDTGAQGPAGGVAGYEIVVGDPVDVGLDDFEVSASATCPAGKVVLGGGATVEDPSLAINLTDSAPTVDAGVYGWHIVVQNYEESAGNSVTAYAICATKAA